MKANLTNATVVALSVAGSLVLVNILSVGLFARVDLTRNGVYTLAKASKETMKSLEEGVTVTAYFTENLPPPYSSNARYVRDLLQEYRAASGGKLGFEFVDPATQETAEDREKRKDKKRDIFGRVVREQTSIEKDLAGQGLQPVEIRVVEEDQAQTKRAYMGLVIKYQEKKEVLPVIQDISTLEYDLTSVIRKMTRSKIPVVAFMQGHEEPQFNEGLNRLHGLLSQIYQVRTVDLGTKEKVDEDVDALLVLGAKTPYKPNEIKAIDQFLMRGKAAAFFLDVIRVDLKTFQPTDTDHGLRALLETYGVTVGDQLVADAESLMLNVAERRGFLTVNMPVPYPFIPQVKRLEGDSPLTAGLTGLAFPFVTALTVNPPEGAKGNTLARSSKKSWLENKPYNIDPRRDWRAETVTPTGPYDLMVEVSGKLRSHYAGDATMSNGSPVPLLAESQGDARVIVVGGSTLAMDDFMGRPNQALMLNVADWLLLDPALLAMRTRGLTDAPLQPELAEATRNTVKYGNVLGLPVLLALYGIVRWRMRESRRATITKSA
jgi:gliding-associated putative ABC transporter substrate-binding component GldG